VDVGFSEAMSVELQQGAYVTQVALKARSIGSAVSTLASRVAVRDLREIGTFGGWLNLWNAPAIPPQGAPLAWMTRDGAYYGGLNRQADLPGLPAQSLVNRLASSSGRTAAALFLQLILRQQEGGIEIALYASRYARLPAVRALAGQIVREQAGYAATESGLLRRYGVAPLPFAGTPALARLQERWRGG
jgi:uncharacterized protein (DUF305 family)